MGRSIFLFSGDKFVEVQQDAADAGPVLQLVKVSGQPVFLARRGPAAETQLERIVEAIVEARAGRFLLNAPGQRSGGFKKHRIVEQVERLQRRVGRPPSRAGETGIRLIEVSQE